MKHTSMALAAAALFACGAANATGLAKCDSGPKDKWQSQGTLEKMLTEKGWKVRKIKEDGGCYEVYALNEAGNVYELDACRDNFLRVYKAFKDLQALIRD